MAVEKLHIICVDRAQSRVIEKKLFSFATKLSHPVISSRLLSLVKNVHFWKDVSCELFSEVLFCTTRHDSVDWLSPSILHHMFNSGAQHLHVILQSSAIERSSLLSHMCDRIFPLRCLVNSTTANSTVIFSIGLKCPRRDANDCPCQLVWTCGQDRAVLEDAMQDLWNGTIRDLYDHYSSFSDDSRILSWPGCHLGITSNVYDSDLPIFQLFEDRYPSPDVTLIPGTPISSDMSVQDWQWTSDIPEFLFLSHVFNNFLFRFHILELARQKCGAGSEWLFLGPQSWAMHTPPVAFQNDGPPFPLPVLWAIETPEFLAAVLSDISVLMRDWDPLELRRAHRRLGCPGIGRLQEWSLATVVRASLTCSDSCTGRKSNSGPTVSDVDRVHPVYDWSQLSFRHGEVIGIPFSIPVKDDLECVYGVHLLGVTYCGTGCVRVCRCWADSSSEVYPS